MKDVLLTAAGCFFPAVLRSDFFLDKTLWEWLPPDGTGTDTLPLESGALMAGPVDGAVAGAEAAG